MDRRRPAEHDDAAHLLIEERDDRPDTAVELLGNRPHMVVLHPEPVADKLRDVRAQGAAVQHHVHDDAGPGPSSCGSKISESTGNFVGAARRARAES